MTVATILPCATWPARTPWPRYAQTPKGVFLMRVNQDPKPGVGTKTIRLADIPRTERLKAARLVARSAKTDKEALLLFLLAHEPGDKGGRIAA